MMKTLIRSMLLTATAIVCLTLPQVARSNPEIIELEQMPEESLEFTQTLTGETTLNCDSTPQNPHWKIEMTEPFPYLRFSIQSEGEPVLIIDGPGGRFCVLADNYSGDHPEMSGLWDAGEYKIYIGNLTPGEYSYTLTISQNPN